MLALETATAVSSIALAEGTDIVASARRFDRRGHISFLVPALDFCFAQAGWEPGDVEVVAVDVGPGLFSGIRAGLATAQAIAAAVGAHLVPVLSLDAIALRAATAHRRIWSVVDARRGEVAVAPYRPVPGGVVRDGPVELTSPNGFRGMLESDPSEILVVGDHQALPEGTLRGLHGVKVGRPRFPVADAVLQAARGKAERGEFPHPDDVRPRYLREPDVTINWTDFRTEGPWQR
jgi:tRNA threonylcarbamoyladenosine biosynthesis protein TsaB